MCYPDLAERKGSVPAAPECGARAGEALHVAGQTSALREAAAAWNPNMMYCKEGCSVPGGFCTLSVPPPKGWEGAAAQTRCCGHREMLGLCLCKSCVWWFLGACTCDMGNTSCPILPLWAQASPPFLAGASTEGGSAAAQIWHSRRPPEDPQEQHLPLHWDKLAPSICIHSPSLLFFLSFPPSASFFLPSLNSRIVPEPWPVVIFPFRHSLLL